MPIRLTAAPKRTRNWGIIGHLMVPAPVLRSSSEAEPPLMIVEASHGWRALDLRELWRYRELFYFLAWRDVKVRYKQTVLGVAWAVLQPLLSVIVSTLIFGRLAHM